MYLNEKYLMYRVHLQNGLKQKFVKVSDLIESTSTRG
jgi:hypothetical protein